MSVIQFPKFNPAAAKLWAKLSADDKMALLANVWCMQCRDETTITNFNGKAERHDKWNEAHRKTIGALFENGLVGVL